MAGPPSEVDSQCSRSRAREPVSRLKASFQRQSHRLSVFVHKPLTRESSIKSANSTASYSYYAKQIGDILMADDFNLLVAICQTTIGGDSAANFAKSIVVWLKQENSSWLEHFLKRILKQKMAENYAKGLDASDTLRENCMTTKLMNSFLWHEGQGYLMDSLHHTMLSIHPFASNCEIDGFRMGRESTSEEIEEHKDYLEKACVMLLASMLGNQHKMPASFRRLCYFMKTEIEKTWGPMAAKPRLEAEEAKSNRASLTMSNYLKRLSNEIVTSISKTGNYIISPSKIEELDQKRPKSEISYSANKEYKISRNSGSWKQDTMMSLSEKAVGSLLFLRFFIPAIISPDRYGLVNRCVTMEERRGFLLCAKVLTGMCNNVDFGKKEAYIRIMNPFIHEYRGMVRSFVKFASASSLGGNRRPPVDGESPCSPHQVFSSNGASEDMIEFLHANISKIERDLQSAVQLFSTNEANHVLTSFTSLKTLVVECMHEQQQQQTSRQSSPQSGPMYRLIRKFGFFQTRSKAEEETSKDGRKNPCVATKIPRHPSPPITDQRYASWA
ncbi:Rho GTPase activation protein [Basidiobolus meristosporus CBS 931.73]|uniref:Rho GTPase activation protein n=1 Tax=Basidiobolus meristosporus CBS 931.73 TaxID=1314790 RepID=A0A1Y1XU36_9FUNG|nr:Rho GTPase activation protein [Basidiobolus meristosporus CBS 931.73]|eukprot:ORX88804.1 Rho GTPase activation protein [Basidiobolus meristosporus CBS 931.73]